MEIQTSWTRCAGPSLRASAPVKLFPLVSSYHLSPVSAEAGVRCPPQRRFLCSNHQTVSTPVWTINYAGCRKHTPEEGERSLRTCKESVSVSEDGGRGTEDE